MNDSQRTALIAILAAVVAFGIGALWQYTSARGYASELETTQTDLEFQRLEATLGAATIEAQRGSYEIARQLASDFYTGLQDHIEDAPDGVRQEFGDILAGRDVMITTLSRSDPQSGSMLAQVFMRLRIAMGEPVGPGGSAPPTSGPVE